MENPFAKITPTLSELLSLKMYLHVALFKIG